MEKLMMICCVVAVMALILAIIAIVKVKKSETFALTSQEQSLASSICPPGYPPINYPVSEKWIKYCTQQAQDSGIVTPVNAPCLCAQSYSFLDSVSV
jgi:hypothetical protein